MATQPATESQSIQDQNKIFQELETYEWDKDAQFQIGLSAILGPNPQPSQIVELTLRAQVFYYSRKKNVDIDFDAYKNYLSIEPTSQSSQAYSQPTQPNMFTNGNTNNMSSTRPNQPPAQDSPSSKKSNSNLSHSSTTSSLHSTDSTTATTYSEPAAPNSPPQAPCPANFHRIVEMIANGEPIPGIKEIPNIVLRGQGTPSRIPKRRKPWEREDKVSEDQVQGRIGGTFGDRRDEVLGQDLPDGGA